MGNPDIIKKKKEIIEEIAKKLEKSQGVYFSNFKGMSAEQVNEMRRMFDKENVEYKVYKNTYISFALKDSDIFEKLKDVFIGNTSIAFSYDDPVAPARVIKDFMKKYKLPKPKAAIVEGKFFDAKGVEEIAKLPSKDVLLSQVVAGIQAPISGFVFTLNGILSDFVYTLQAIKEKKDN